MYNGKCSVYEYQYICIKYFSVYLLLLDYKIKIKTFHIKEDVWYLFK